MSELEQNIAKEAQRVSLRDNVRSNFKNSIQVCKDYPGTGELIVLATGTTTSFQIVGDDTFACNFHASLDGVNYVQIGTEITESALVNIDPYNNAHFKFEITANAGLISIVLA
jgi:hypothetical protein